MAWRDVFVRAIRGETETGCADRVQSNRHGHGGRGGDRH